MEHENYGDTYCDRCSRYSHQRIGAENGGLGNKRTTGDQPNYSIVEIGQNSKKNTVDLGRLAVTKTPVDNHQLTSEWMTKRKNSQIQKDS